jgi:hypothetical protein
MEFVIAAQATHSNTVGFLTRRTLADYCDSNRILIATLDSVPVAYLAGNPLLRWQPLLRPITQIVVAAPAQRRHIATQLIHAHTAAAVAAGQTGLQAICRADLDANAFWRARGFIKICYLTPKTARRVPLIVWRLPLTRNIPIWFANPPARAGRNAARPSPPHREGTLYVRHDPHRWNLPR